MSGQQGAAAGCRYALPASTGTSRAEPEALRAAKAERNGAFGERLVWSGNQVAEQR
jgi:hypothetical protein